MSTNKKVAIVALITLFVLVLCYIGGSYLVKKTGEGMNLMADPTFRSDMASWGESTPIATQTPWSGTVYCPDCSDTGFKIYDCGENDTWSGGCRDDGVIAGIVQHGDRCIVLRYYDFGEGFKRYKVKCGTIIGHSIEIEVKPDPK
jgi:hypothetical protein